MKLVGFFFQEAEVEVFFTAVASFKFSRTRKPMDATCTVLHVNTMRIVWEQPLLAPTSRTWLFCSFVEVFATMVFPPTYIGRFPSLWSKNSPSSVNWMLAWRIIRKGVWKNNVATWTLSHLSPGYLEGWSLQ